MATSSKPNVVFIVGDNVGWGDVGCYGAKGFKTPNLDRMAAEGTRFTSFYTGCSVCSGSRAALTTGRPEILRERASAHFDVSRRVRERPSTWVRERPSTWLAGELLLGFWLGVRR